VLKPARKRRSPISGETWKEAGGGRGEKVHEKKVPLRGTESFTAEICDGKLGGDDEASCFGSIEEEVNVDGDRLGCGLRRYDGEGRVSIRLIKDKDRGVTVSAQRS
jgi:hypothetical protein